MVRLTISEGPCLIRATLGSHIYYVGDTSETNGKFTVTLDGEQFSLDSRGLGPRKTQVILFHSPVNESMEHNLTVANSEDGTHTTLDCLMCVFAVSCAEHVPMPYNIESQPLFQRSAFN